MLNCPDNVRQDIVKLVPSSVVNEICCFAFYDHHPLDSKELDITICTSRGEVKEYYQRIAVCYFSLDPCSALRKIRILRNHKNELYYLLVLEGEIVILSRTDSIRVHKIIKNVESFDVHDSACRGQAFLKVICKDDAVPLIFDDNFESLGDAALVLSQLSSCDTLPLMLDLKRKLSEAKYNVKCLEKSYKELIKLRQNLTFSSFRKIHSNLENSLKELDILAKGQLQLKTKKPWLKFCNKRIIIILELLNRSSVPIKNVHMLLHRTIKSTIAYTTKMYEKIPEMPFWKELTSNSLNTVSKTAVVAIIDRKELKNCVSSTVVFSAVICYTVHDKEYLLPVEDVTVSAMDTMNESFDALSNEDKDSPEKQYVLLSILASSIKTDLCLKHIKIDDESDLNTETLFCEYLGMESLLDKGLLVYRHSPYHILYGVMVVLEKEPFKNYLYEISVYTRSSSQVLAMIHYIHDAVPHRIVVNTPSQVITAKTVEFTTYNEDEHWQSTSKTNLLVYGTSILNQSSMVLDYLDKCMIRMNESKNPVVQLKVGSEIDVFADDKLGFLDFKMQLLQEASKETALTILIIFCMILAVSTVYNMEYSITTRSL